MDTSEAETLPTKRAWGYREAASYLGIHPATLRKKVMLRAIPCVKPFGRRGRTLFFPEDLERFLEDSRVPAEV